MEEKIKNVSYNESKETIEFKIRDEPMTIIDLKELQTKFESKLSIILNEKNIPKYIYGGGNIVFYMKDKSGKEYVLRFSILTKFNIDEYRKEINKYYQLSELKIGVEIYYPLKDQISSYNNRYIIIENYDKGSAISFFKTANPIVKKEKVIDKIFELIDSSIENEIYCLDVKFRNFVVKFKLIGEEIDVDVKMIDFEGCLLPINSIICGNYLSMDYKKSVYKNIILIQVFYSCPVYLQSYYLCKLNIENIISVYNILQEKDNLKNSLGLFSNFIFYYLKNEFFNSFFTFKKEFLNKNIFDGELDKLVDDVVYINIYKLLRTQKLLSVQPDKILSLVHLFLYILFTQIVDLKFNFNQINVIDKDKYKIEFNPEFKFEFINELLSKFETYQDNESSEELCCVISDGKLIKKKRKKSKSIKRKKRSKSIKRKKRSKSIKRKKSKSIKRKK